MSELHNAAMNGDSTSIARLLDRGAAVEAKDAHGNTSLKIASSTGHTTILPLLLDCHAALSAKDVQALISSAHSGSHFSTVALLLSR